MPGSALTGHTDAVEHTIDTGDSPPIRCAPRRMSPQTIKQEETCVEEMLTGGQIEPSDSPWSAPVVLVTKKDGGTRFCVDYRRLNLVTVKDAYPLPRIDDTLDMLAGKQWLSTLDLASGYWQVSLRSQKNRRCQVRAYSGLPQECPAVPGVCGLLPAFYCFFLVWGESLVRSRMKWNVSSPTAVAPYGHPKENIALQKGKCWQPSPCAYSFVHTCTVLSSPFVQITSLSCGSIVLKTQRV